MSTDQLWETLNRRWWWLAIGVFAGLAVGIAAMLLIPPTYRSEALILLDAQSADGGVDATNYIDERLVTYADLGRGDAVQDDIRDRLGEDLTREEIEGSVAFVPTSGSMVISVTGTGRTSADARETADAAAFAFASAVEATSTASVTVTTDAVQRATLPSSPEDPDPLIVLPAAVLAGLLVPVLIALVRGPRRSAGRREGTPR